MITAAAWEINDTIHCFFISDTYNGVAVILLTAYLILALDRERRNTEILCRPGRFMRQ